MGMRRVRMTERRDVRGGLRRDLGGFGFGGPLSKTARDPLFERTGVDALQIRMEIERTQGAAEVRPLVPVCSGEEALRSPEDRTEGNPAALAVVPRPGVAAVVTIVAEHEEL